MVSGWAAVAHSGREVGNRGRRFKTKDKWGKGRKRGRLTVEGQKKRFFAGRRRMRRARGAVERATEGRWRGVMGDGRG